MTADKPRRGRPGYDRQDVILAAVAAFDEHGYEGTTVGMIADRLGITKSAIYHHVQSKEEILASALERSFTALDEGLAAAADPDGDITVTFEQSLRDMTRVLVEYQPYVRLLLRLRENNPTQAAAWERRRGLDTTMTQVVRRAQDAGVVRNDLDPGIVARLLFGAVNSTVDWYHPTGRIAPEDLVESVVTFILDGVGARR